MPGTSRQSEGAPLNNQAVINNASGTGRITLWGTQNLNYHVDRIFMSSTDAIAHHVRLYLLQNAVVRLIGSATLPALQGTAGTPAVDLLSSVLPAGIDGLPLDGVTEVHVSVEEVVTAATEIDFFGIAGTI